MTMTQRIEWFTQYGLRFFIRMRRNNGIKDKVLLITLVSTMLTMQGIKYTMKPLLRMLQGFLNQGSGV
ncbi:E4 [Rangifer tarandus papillomavirus 2]|uniref:E4 n=1 Tax=Rangifer tarandus papillomavirus 2 TaxID=1370094 RepID=S5RDA5_9PAPI|nr:E4 [Rangifer tarandus papillomavirus 2]AGS08608.1 E4 [Rangifer tarandus papillomavirus 2]